MTAPLQGRRRTAVPAGDPGRPAWARGGGTGAWVISRADLAPGARVAEANPPVAVPLAPAIRQPVGWSDL
jgi:hypothetical protein